MGKKIRALRLKRQQQQAQSEAARVAAEAQAKEQQAISNASAVTDSGRTTSIVNDTTSTPGANAAVSDDGDLMTYINDMRNRRKKAAALPQLSGVLGQTGALGV